MSTRLNHACSALLVLLPAISINLLSQADSQTAPTLPPASIPSPRPLPRGPSTDYGVHDYQLSSIYDRVGGRTRLSVVPMQKSQPSLVPMQKNQPSFDRPYLSFAVSVTYPGRDLVVPPDSVVFEFTVFAPARLGWAFGHPEPLEITLDDSVHLEFPNTAYERMAVRFTDPGRSELMVFRVPIAAFLSLAASSKAKLRVGHFTVKLDAHSIEGLQALADRLTPAVQ